jgi:hypothetical protein
VSLPSMTWPDAALLVVDHLRGVLDTYSTTTYPSLDGYAVGVKVPDGRPVPFVRVGRVGGTRDGLFDQPRILVESWAGTSFAAAANTDLIRDAMWQLPGVRSGHHVSALTEVGGPADIADPETGSPRYLMTFAFRVRGNPRT